MEVRIRATDAGKLNFEDTVTISVLNRNDSPTSITATKLEVAENLTGADVGSFNVADPDGDSIDILDLAESFDVLSYILLRMASGDWTMGRLLLNGLIQVLRPITTPM